MVNEITEEQPTVIRWSEDGTRFFLNSYAKEEMKQIISRYFERT